MDARNLSLGRKGCIGVAGDSTEDPWFTQLLTGIEEELATRDASLMLASLELRGNYDVAPCRTGSRPPHRRADRAEVVAARPRLLEAAMDSQLPTVQVAPHEILRMAAVIRGDNLTAGRTVASHLASLGHRVVGFAGGPRYSLDSQHRLRGLRDELRRRGVALHARSTAFCGSYQAEAGARFAQKLLERPLDVTAMVFGNDALALGFMCVAQQRASACRAFVDRGLRQHRGGRAGLAGPDDRRPADARNGARRVPLPLRGRLAPPAAERRVSDGAGDAREHRPAEEQRHDVNTGPSRSP